MLENKDTNKQERKLQVKVPEDMMELIQKDPELKYVRQYNTGLTEDEFKKFYDWGLKKYGNLENLIYEMGTYDVQGAWKSGDVFKTDERGHGPDKWKKPNHRTFSTESIYSSKETPGGRWVRTPYGPQFHPSKITLDLYGVDDLQHYFKEKEPDVKLMWQNPNNSY